MKKALLTSSIVISLLAATTVSIHAQETTTAEVTTTVEVLETEDLQVSFEKHVQSFLDLLPPLLAEGIEKEASNELTNYLNYLTSKELIKDEATASLIQATHAYLTGEQKAETGEFVPNSVLAAHSYVLAVSEFVENAEDLSDEQIESIWRSIKVLEKLEIVNEDDEDYLKAKVVLAKAEYVKLLEENFNEDGTFKEKLYSKELTAVHQFLSHHDSKSIKTSQAKYDKLLSEIKARRAAQEALTKIEEKRANGEAISDEELKEVEALTDKVQTSSVRENVSTVKESVKQSQDAGTGYTPSTPPTPPAAPVVTEAPAPQPIVTEAPTPAFVPDGVTTFWTFSEADSYGYNYMMANYKQIASYLVYEVPNADGTTHFALHFEYRP